MESFTFDDIFLVPQKTSLRSRSEADTSVKIWKHKRPNPVISANMKTVTNSKMAVAMWDAGGIGALHRFMSIEENVDEYRKVSESKDEVIDCFVSIGVHDPERAEALYQAGARMFIIDIAHGHSIQMEETLKWMRDKWGDDVYIMAGNVATGDGAGSLFIWGADVIKVGVGCGAVCTTRLVTGHGVPQFSAIRECHERRLNWNTTKEILIVADGGIRSSGDIVKSIVAGADMVMMGGLLVPAIESAAQVDHNINNPTFGKKIYKGSAAEPERGQVASEGTYTCVSIEGSAEEIVSELVAGLRSGMSYSNARTVSELKKNAKWGRQTYAGFHEGTPHGKR